jgi:hypothetical protein
MDCIMSLELRLKRANVSYTTGRFSPAIDLGCSPVDSTGVLEIGEKYVFASGSNFASRGKRRLRHLQIRVIRKSELKPETTEELNLSESLSVAARWKRAQRASGSSDSPFCSRLRPTNGWI